MPADRDELHFLYELCVQRPESVVKLIRAAHAARGSVSPALPRVLHEDFSGTGAISREWVSSDAAARALATDIDRAALDFGRSRAAAANLDSSRLTWREASILSLPTAQHITAPTSALADAIFVGNFSIGELHTRDDLLSYLRAARSRLSPAGVFICDTYGGAAAFRTGLVHRTHSGREPAERILYTWEQRSIDPFTARVVNALHFRIERAGEIIAEHFDAFTYHWRLWSVPELRDAMLEAGFTNTRILSDIESGSTTATTPDPQSAADHHIVCVAAYS